MEIILKGSLPSEAVFRANCSKCKTMFRFKKAETRPSPDQRDAGQFYIECPLTGCGTTIWNSAFVPEPTPDPRSQIPAVARPNYYRDH